MDLPEDDNPYAPPTASNPDRVPAWPAFGETKFLVVPPSWQSPPICLLTGATANLLPVRGARTSYYLSPQAVRKLKSRTIINWFIFGMGLLLAILALLPNTSDAGRVLILPGVLLVLVSGALARTWRMPVCAWKIEDARIWIAGIPAPVRNAIVQMEQALANQRARNDHTPGTPPE